MSKHRYPYVYIVVLQIIHHKQTRKRNELKLSTMSAMLMNNPMFDRTDYICKRIPNIRLEQHYYYPLQQQNNNGEDRMIRSPR